LDHYGRSDYYFHAFVDGYLKNVSKNRVTKEKNFLPSKIAGLVFLLVLFLVSTSVFKEYKKQQKLENRITELRQELVDLEQNNLELTKMVGYLESSEYLEMEARSNLGYKKAGEKVVVIDSSKQELPKKNIKEVSNQQKWFNYFFN
jgi:cell division protein FtsB